MTHQRLAQPTVAARDDESRKRRDILRNPAIRLEQSQFPGTR
jgi:hypothetical protein